MINSKKRKPIINFLLNKWESLSESGAIERIHQHQINVCRLQNLPIAPGELIQENYIQQISKIRSLITKIIPEAKFIDVDYESPALLQPEDFLELYVSHQKLCIDKVKSLIKDMRIK